MIGNIAERITAILPEIAKRSAEIDALANVPADLLAKIEQAGGFSMATPVEFGGAAMSLRAICKVIFDVATADASLAWQMGTAVGTQILTARLPHATLVRYYETGPDTWAKGAYTPKTVAQPVEGGYRLTGRWPFASGARQYEWVALGSMVAYGKGVKMMPDGQRPDIRVGLLRKDAVKVIETWNVVGLRGTRSDDLEVTDLFIPEAWQGSFFGGSNLDAPVLNAAMPSATAPLHSSIMLGIVQAAMNDLAQSSLTRRAASNPRMFLKDDPVFLNGFGILCSKFNSLKALNADSIDTLELITAAGRETDPLSDAKLCSDGSYVNHECLKIMDEIMTYAGASAIYNENAQQRRWRDLRCAAQHQAANTGNFGRYGNVLLSMTEPNETNLQLTASAA